MIKSLTANNNWIQINTSYSSVPPINPGAQSAGMLRWNTSSNSIEVYNGISWHSIETHGSVDLSENAKQALSWAYDKMGEEIKLLELLEKHPGLKDLHDKFHIMKVLCQEEEKEKTQ